MRLVRRLVLNASAHPRLSAAVPVVAGLDRTLRAVSSGHVTVRSLVGVPELSLTVRDHASGWVHTLPLACTPLGAESAESATAWIVTAPLRGAAVAPQWVEDLRAVARIGGTAVVDVKARSHIVVPRELHGSDRDRAWRHVVALRPQRHRDALDATTVWQLTAQ